MPKRNRPFAVFKHRSGVITIVPRGIAGWSQTLAWLAVLAAICLWFAEKLAVMSDTPDFGGWVVLLVCGIAGWFICCMWWIYGRAEVIDREVWLRDQHRKQRTMRRKQD